MRKIDLVFNFDLFKHIPVYPYANIVPLYPSATDSIKEKAVVS